MTSRLLRPSDQYRKRHGQLPNENCIRAAIKSLRTQVHSPAPPRPVDVRIVKSATAIFIDLANPEGEAVQITPTNWQITGPFEVAFRSTGGQRAGPTPFTYMSGVERSSGKQQCTNEVACTLAWLSCLPRRD